jgi:MerR family transcriptional regulator/heat shock protein HspR
MTVGREDPVYAIGVVARMVGLHAQTLRNYERWGLVKPHRPGGRVRLYSQRDVERIRQINEWMDDLGINVAGVEVMTRLLTRISQLESQLAQLTIEVVNLRGGPRRLPGQVASAPRQSDGSGVTRRRS